ncbi:hypothetical protein AK812_SmicGene410 [Symbiodinium microadriaticum]|uniref:Uncharacterized protein n=1 Tax=Symbiodinium microadriaticum TaxID=2951 RepID=A0A1Q9F6T2_SYMMI|nr:hypothetical protein AK812_SmicGene410 [Symbiodinium microadriaticum]
MKQIACTRSVRREPALTGRGSATGASEEALATWGVSHRKDKTEEDKARSCIAGAGLSSHIAASATGLIGEGCVFF